MVLLARSGTSIAAIARKTGTNRTRVGDWLRRIQTDGVAELKDQPHCERPVEVTSIERHQVIATACSEPSEFGLERATWSHESLTEALEGRGLVRSISSTVGRILSEAEIKPHRRHSALGQMSPLNYERRRAPAA